MTTNEPRIPCDLLRSIHELLRKSSDRLVLVESCTAGLVASQFGCLPGISDSWCGSLVVYRNASKSDWLGLDSEMLNDPKIGPVSRATSLALAEAALKRTPEATVAAAITGHLGPNSPDGLDGHVYVHFARRSDDKLPSRPIAFLLTSPPPLDNLDIERRIARQEEATRMMLEGLELFLEREESPPRKM